MKTKNNKLATGSSTLEILIAFAILSLSMSAVIMVIFGNQSVSVDTETNNEAIYKSKKMLESARALSRQNFSSLLSTTTTETSGNITYSLKLSVTDLTQCKKQATSTATWTIGGTKTQKVELGTYLTDPITALALGGDCIDSPPTSNWDNPQRFASDTMSPGKPTALDELNRFAYLGADKTPFLYIASTTYAVLGQTSGLFLSFTNGFDLLYQPNAIDTVRDQSTGNIYAYVALASSTKQLAVVNVTTPTSPTVVYKGLSSCVSGSYPEGYLVYYYKNTLYLTTLYTAGPEFHIFDASNLSNPVEYPIGSVACKGLELGNSVNDIAVVDQIIGGAVKRYAYMATDESDKELRVFDVTNPLSITEVFAANQNLPGAQNGLSLFIIGNKLYLGRQSTPSGPDLYVYDISNPTLGLTQLGSVDIGTGVLAIRVAGKFAFLATPRVNQEFQVWNISNPGNITNIARYNFGNIVSRGIDYDPDFIYSTGQSTPNFQIIYSP
jgi:Tfp pilus assembly protein PilV